MGCCSCILATSGQWTRGRRALLRGGWIGGDVVGWDASKGRGVAGVFTVDFI